MSDLIRRQDAIDAADRADYTGLTVEDVKKVTDEVVKELKQLPSAYSNEEIQKMQELEQAQLEKAYDIGREMAITEQEKSNSNQLSARDAARYIGQIFGYPCDYLMGTIDIYDVMRYRYPDWCVHGCKRSVSDCWQKWFELRKEEERGVNGGSDT